MRITMDKMMSYLVKKLLLAIKHFFNSIKWKIKWLMMKLQWKIRLLVMKIQFKTKRLKRQTNKNS
jgi:hypothetical protein